MNKKPVHNSTLAEAAVRPNAKPRNVGGTAKNDKSNKII